MDTNNHTPRIKDEPGSDATRGRISWSAKKSLWYVSHCLLAVIGVCWFFSFSALLVFLSFTAITLCLGHSLGMHRRFIHNSYECPLWLEYFFVHLGVLVGMAGPLGMMEQHDMRDWAQRKKQCHAYLRHGKGFWHDGWWQLHCELVLDKPPLFEAEERIKNDSIYQIMERTWMLQQVPWAIILFYFGGISWVLWGISARVAVSVTGHWLVGYFAHNGMKKQNVETVVDEEKFCEREWFIESAAVQGHNVRFAGFITMGESWHNNHHAFPGSAVLGVYKGQVDPGWWVLNALTNVGLAWNVKLPSDMPYRQELKSLANHQKYRELKTPRACSLIRLLS